jgi:hypothetical protein
MRFKVLAAFLLVWTAADAADREFEQIVKAIESQYGVKPTHIPLLGLGNLLLKTAHPQGVSGFRIAVFENLDAHERGRENFDAVMNRIGNSDLRPLVQVRSRRNGESTYIFTGTPGKATRILVASLEDREATVIEVKADTEALLRLLRDPAHIGDALGVHRDEDDR